MGKEGGEVPVCRRDPGLPGGIAVAAARPQRQLLHPISAFVGFAEVGVLGAAQLGSWCLEETGWLAGCSGKHLWALSADGELGWTQRNQNCCVILAVAAVARVTGEFPTLPPAWWQVAVGRADRRWCPCRRIPKGCLHPSLLGSRDQRPCPVPQACAVWPPALLPPL